MRKILRFVCLLMAMLCLLPSVLAEGNGDEVPPLRGWNKKDGYVYLTLGAFPQTKEGERLPILWRVLSVEDGKVFLLSEYVLEARPLHGNRAEYVNKPTNKKKPGFNGDYTQTDMAKYLNGEFTANFTEGELALIAVDAQLGSFFLLSVDELKNKAYGFTSDASRKGWGTDYALANGLFKYMAKRGEHSPYWTRTQSTSSKQAARCTKSTGTLGYIDVEREDEGMRPACWLDLAQVQLASGAGTMEDPFVLNTAQDEPVIAEVVPLEEPTTEE